VTTTSPICRSNVPADPDVLDFAVDLTELAGGRRRQISAPAGTTNADLHRSSIVDDQQCRSRVAPRRRGDPPVVEDPDGASWSVVHETDHRMIAERVFPCRCPDSLSEWQTTTETSRSKCQSGSQQNLPQPSATTGRGSGRAAPRPPPRGRGRCSATEELIIHCGQQPPRGRMDATGPYNAAWSRSIAKSDIASPHARVARSPQPRQPPTAHGLHRDVPPRRHSR